MQQYNCVERTEWTDTGKIGNECPWVVNTSFMSLKENVFIWTHTQCPSVFIFSNTGQTQMGFLHK